MLKITTAKEMQRIDRVTIEKYGIAGTVLMERAGLAVVSRINKNFFQNTDFQSTDKRRIVILCGGGNNGGDGFVIARILHNQGRGVELYLTARPETLKGDAKINYDAARKFGVKIYPAGRFLKSRFPNVVIVDALLGTGLSKEVRTPLSDIIKKINRLSSPVVSVDIPSGISSDTGRVMGCAVKAQCTVAFGLPKRGHLLYPGAGYTGDLYIEDIGFPQKLLASEKIKINLVQKEDALSLLPGRPGYSHKGSYGHALLIAGSKGKTGAALMAAKACLRTGAGLVTIGIPETLVNTFQSRVTEEMILPLPDKGNGTLSGKAADAVLGFIEKRANVLAIGPGISVDDEISCLVSLLITETGVPVVIDADGINAIAGRTGVLKKSRTPVILTPHPGEMARLLRQNTEHRAQNTDLIRTGVEQDRINTATSFAKKTRTYLVLKGAPTVTATPDGKAFINSTGNPGMATAGTGDVLTGMISAFLAQNLNPQSAAILGVYMHGLIGDIAAEKKGEHSLIASDIINSIPRVFRSILNH
ncbi:MAG TPA: NAD(P)H-hydrate dehydratase [Nitrospirae bacterium]|nr:NAD(P)H-hydrate dehydratase [Nitrospirota bacterium]